MTDEWLTIKQAAERLQMHQRTVRDKAGTLREEDRQKGVGGTLLVRFAALEAKVRGETPVPLLTNTEPDPKHIEHLEAEIEFLRRRLEARDQADAENRQLMAADRSEIARLRAQLAIPEGEKREEDGVRPWWKWWKR